MRRWIPALIIVAATLATVIVYPSLPDRIPTHWNMAGEVDGWSGRFWGAWLMPLMMAVLWPLLRLLPHIDPRRANYEKFSEVYEWLVIAILAFMLGLHLLVLISATGRNLPIGQIIPGAVGALFIVIGALLPRAHPNWFIGIRTPWTLSSDRSWQQTHKVGGLLFIVVGALAIVASVVVPRAAVGVLMVTGMGTAIFLLAYSYLVWKRDKEGRSAV